MKLYPDLIPHEKFHKGIWLSNPNTPWYYFLTTKRDYKLPTNKTFYNNVDELLKPIVWLLHKNNIPTTPSCSGHFFSKNHYSPTYDSLLTNKKVINNKGVIFNDEETGKKYFYQNKNYNLPWNKNEFLDKIYNYQTKGVLGFKDKNKELYNNLDIPNLIHDNGITIILTQSKNKKDCYDTWKSIHNNLSNLI